MGSSSLPGEQEFGAAAKKEAARIDSDMKDIEEDITRLEKQTNAKRGEWANLAERLSIIKKIFELDSSKGSAASNGVKAKLGASGAAAEACNEAERYLRKIGRHGIHFRGIGDELLRNGVKLNGKDPASTLVAYMVADKQDRFCRPERQGVYALREFWPTLERSVGEKNRSNEHPRA